MAFCYCCELPIASVTFARSVPPASAPKWLSGGYPSAGPRPTPHSPSLAYMIQRCFPLPDICCMLAARPQTALPKLNRAPPRGGHPLGGGGRCARTTPYCAPWWGKMTCDGHPCAYGHPEKLLDRPPSIWVEGIEVAPRGAPVTCRLVLFFGPDDYTPVFRAEPHKSTLVP